MNAIAGRGVSGWFSTECSQFFSVGDAGQGGLGLQPSVDSAGGRGETAGFVVAKGRAKRTGAYALRLFRTRATPQLRHCAGGSGELTRIRKAANSGPFQISSRLCSLRLPITVPGMQQAMTSPLAVNTAVPQGTSHGA